MSSRISSPDRKGLCTYEQNNICRVAVNEGKSCPNSGQKDFIFVVGMLYKGMIQANEINNCVEILAVIIPCVSCNSSILQGV